MIVNVITRPVMKLEHPEDLSFFHECHTFLYQKLLSGYVRVLDLSSFLPPLLNNKPAGAHGVGRNVVGVGRNQVKVKRVCYHILRK